MMEKSDGEGIAMDYAKLQNGSDIRGVALENPEGQPVTLTERTCRDIGRGFALWLDRRHTKDGPLRVAVGRDSRLSGPAMAAWTAQALAESGIQVTDLGLASTPAMFMSTVTPGWEFDGAVMITASHLPFHRNGFKFFTPAGGLESGDIRAILELAAGSGVTGRAPGQVESGSFMDVYAAGLVQRVRAESGQERPLEGRRILVDAGNGVGGFYADKVLTPLGADTAGSLYLGPDGSFPNHIPNPELPEAMDGMIRAVKERKADLGVVFDTDVDRAGAVLAGGEALNRNRLIAMLSAILLEEHPGTAIVTDSITSTGLGEFIAARGGIHRRFRRGYRNVINEAIRLNAQGQDCQLAIETSGHAALKENRFLDDGAYLITKLLIQLARGRDLKSLIAGLPEPAESREFRMRLLPEDFRAAGQDILAALEAQVPRQPGWQLAPDNCEGVRVNLDREHGDGWFLLRLSLHDPILPLNVESNVPGGVQRIARELSAFLRGFEALDARALEEYAGN